MRNRVALLACIFVLAPALAYAAGVITVTESSNTSAGGLSDEVINIAECDGTVTDDTLSFAWTYGALPGSDRSARVFAQTSEACPAENTLLSAATGLNISGTNLLDINGTQSSGILPTAVNVRTGIIEPLGVQNYCTAGGTIYFCVVVVEGSSESSLVRTAYEAKGSITINVAKPAAPTGVSARSGDGALTVSWTDGSPAASSWVVTAAPDPTPPGDANCTVTATATVTQDCSSSGCRVANLTNDACYSVTVQGFSAFNNPSDVSAAASGVPRPADDFWEVYKGAGGVEEGGCGSGSASALALLVLASVAPRLRRRRP